jgi:hypothetical protein
MTVAEGDNLTDQTRFADQRGLPVRVENLVIRVSMVWHRIPDQT